MSFDELNAADCLSAGLIMRPEVSDTCAIVGRYRAECFDSDGLLKWVEEFNNLVVNTGDVLNITYQVSV